MNREHLTKLVEDGKSIRQIASETGRSPSGIRHWLRKFGLSTKKPLKYDGKCKFCSCELTDLNTYSGKRNWACKKCFNKYRAEQFTKNKQAIIDYKGGRCEGCGWEGHYAAFDFHHRDPSQKDYEVSKTNKGWEQLTAEADKCALLCARCHRLVHAGVLTLSDRLL